MTAIDFSNPEPDNLPRGLLWGLLLSIPLWAGIAWRRRGGYGV